MTPHPRLSRDGIELVKRFEGLRPRAARLESGGWTIGYGHTASARDGGEVTPDDAEALLIYDLDRVARAIDPLIFTALNSNQFNALVAFVFNIGVEPFAASTVLKQINQGAFLEAAAAMELWRRAEFGGEKLVVDGLVRRRAAEKLLFLTPPDGFRAVPTPVLRPAYDAVATNLATQGWSLAGAADLEAPLEGADAIAYRRQETGLDKDALAVSAPLQQLFSGADIGPAALAPGAQPARELDSSEPPPPLLVESEPPRASPVRRPKLESVPESESVSFLVLAFGAGGALLFIGALLAMLVGDATVLNLMAGLVGVAAMTPAGLRLLPGLFGRARR